MTKHGARTLEVTITWRGDVKYFTGPASKCFFDATIVAVYFWAVLHDRPVSWACNPDNWPPELLEMLRRLPSQSTMSRRLRSLEVRHLLATMEEELRCTQKSGWVWIVDGKPLPISGYSKDPDAKVGYATAGFAKGYKLHAIYGQGALPAAWEVAPMNTAEPEMAARLVSLRRCQGDVLGDNSYDINALHAAARAAGCQLVAERKRPGTGLGHGVQTAGRLRSMALLRQPFGQALLDCRDDIERSFGWLTNHSAGLAPLPAWVRRIDRVTLWVQAKLLGHWFYVQRKSRHRVAI